MTHDSLDLLRRLARDPANGWSIGSFGAIGEFVRDPDEVVEIVEDEGLFQIATARGAMRIAPAIALKPIAWDSLSADGESWGHALSFCVERPETGNRTIRALGLDRDAIRDGDRGHDLFDLGVGAGAVTMCLRTGDDALIAAMRQAEGMAMLSVAGLMGQVLRAQPHRVLLSPAGRIEVFQPIPPADGKSPVGPHTHLLPKLVAKDRTHSANVPIPEAMQSALSVHPRSPWRTMLGEKHPFDADIDAAFAPYLARYGLPQDAEVDAALLAAIAAGATPDSAEWPDTRRGRTTSGPNTAPAKKARQIRCTQPTV